MVAPPRRSRVRLGPGGEFDLIRSLLGARSALRSDVLVGPGDDCAILEAGAHPWALSVDLAIEGVHFRRKWLSLEEVGERAACAALSDLAAVAAEPVALLLSLALSGADAEAGAATALQRGADRAARAVGAAIVGGDVTRSPGPLVLDVVVVGRAPSPLLRDGGRRGDELWVTGRLGAAGAAVLAWERGEIPSPRLRDAFAHPTPRVAESRWLADTGCVHALIDLSDGLAGDAGHLAAASGCRARIEGLRVPVAEGVGAPDGEPSRGLGVALEGGEDYELCMAAEPGALEPLRGAFEERFGIPLTLVGRLEEGEGVVLDAGDGRAPVPVTGGYSHFEAEGR